MKTTPERLICAPGWIGHTWDEGSYVGHDHRSWLYYRCLRCSRVRWIDGLPSPIKETHP